MRILLRCLVVFLFAFYIGNAQEITKKHTVNKGETVYQLSRLYNVSPAEIIKLNPNSENIIHVGEVLLIPNNNTNSHLNLSTYIVTQGDTKYGLAKKFGITIQELENNNPHIKNGLQAGHILNITNNVMMATEQNTYKTYLVKKGDTKYSLSKKFNVSIVDLEGSNPQIIKMLQYGMTINIPSKENNSIAEAFNQESPIKNEAILVTDAPKQGTREIIVHDSQTLKTSEYKNLSHSINKDKKIDILIVTPFSDVEFQEYEKIKDFEDSSSFTYEHLEIYRGMKAAIDSVKSLGLNVNIQSINLDYDETLATTKIDSLDNFDGILIPFRYHSNSLASIASNITVPIISAYPIPYNDSQSTIFEALPSIELQRLTMLEFLNEKNGNIIVLSDLERDISRNFIKKNTPNATIIETKISGDFNNSTLKSSLVKDKTNYVIVDSENRNVFLNSTNTLLRELPNYSIQLVVLESELIPDESQISHKRFKILKLLYPSLNEVDSSLIRLEFLKNYKEEYRFNASNYALIGFDITFDTLLRFYQDIGFEESIKKDKTVYLNVTFDYKKSEFNKYVNTAITILEYQNQKPNVGND